MLKLNFNAYVGGCVMGFMFISSCLASQVELSPSCENGDPSKVKFYPTNIEDEARDILGIKGGDAVHVDVQL